MNPKKKAIRRAALGVTNPVSTRKANNDYPENRAGTFIFTPEIIKNVESLAGMGLTQKQICGYFGISTDTFQLRARENPEIDTAIHRGRSKGIATVSQAAYNMAVSGRTPDMTKFYLKAKAGWKETERIEHTGDENKPIVTEHRSIDTSKLSLEEKRILLKGLKKQQSGNES